MVIFGLSGLVDFAQDQLGANAQAIAKLPWFWEPLDATEELTFTSIEGVIGNPDFFYAVGKWKDIAANYKVIISKASTNGWDNNIDFCFAPTVSPTTEFTDPRISTELANFLVYYYHPSDLH